MPECWRKKSGRRRLRGKSGPDISLLRSLLGADEQAAAAAAVGAEKKRYADVFNRVEHGGMNGHCTGCAISWLLGLRKLYCWRRRLDLRFAPEFVARHIAEWQHQNPLDLIITGCQSSEGQNGQTPFLLAEMLGWPCFTQVGAFHSRRAVYHPRTAY
ncbi:hypothetical protein KZ770_10035 [Escherichia coli]|nr:hypothetical protein [Escherichia coli]